MFGKPGLLRLDRQSTRYQLTKPDYSITNEENNCIMSSIQAQRINQKTTKQAIQSLEETLSLIMNNSLLTY